MAFNGGHATAVVQWMNSVKVSDTPVDHVAELADGELLLKVMHEAAPHLFPGHNAVHLWRLLEGLQMYFQGRHSAAERSANDFLEQVTAGRRRVDTERLAELVVFGAVECDDAEQRRRYIEACQTLPHEAQQGIISIIQSFHAEEAAGGASRDGHTARPGLFKSKEQSLANEEAQLREDRRRWEEEVSGLKVELEDERERRRSAEEAERVARAELRLADEARERVKDEQRMLFELRLEQEVEGFQEELHGRCEELAQLQEELDIARNQASAADRLSGQLRDAKKKIEELKRTNDDLQMRIDGFASGRAGAAAVEHLHVRLEQMRTEVTDASAQRDAAQHQVKQLNEKFEQLKSDCRQAKEENAVLKRELQVVGGDAPETPQAVVRRAPSLTFEEVKPVDTAPSRRSVQESRPPKIPASPKEVQMDELRQLINSKQDDLLERLLAEKERATKAETKSQLQREEADRMQEQHRRDAERIASLEIQLRMKASAPAVQEDPKAEKIQKIANEAESGKIESGKILEMQELVAQRDRELQVHRWRSRADTESLRTQEALMVACCHELGLRYQRLQVQCAALQKRLLAAEGHSPGAGSAATNSFGN